MCALDGRRNRRRRQRDLDRRPIAVLGSEPRRHSGKVVGPCQRNGDPTIGTANQPCRTAGTGTTRRTQLLRGGPFGQDSQTLIPEPIREASARAVKKGGNSNDAVDKSNGHRNPRVGQQLSATLRPQRRGVDVDRRPFGHEGLPRHKAILLAAIYDECIGFLELSVSEYNDFITSPWVAEHIAGADRTTMLLVNGSASVIASPGSLPVVVCWVGTDFGGEGAEQADLVVSGKEVADLTAAVARNPLAATTLAVLLRSSVDATVEAALAQESAAYSMLQAGPEFAAWRAGATRAPVVAEQEPAVAVARENDALTVTLNRPERHNAISTRLRDELCEALAIAVVDNSINKVILRGNGPSFCSGGDLAEFGSRQDPATAHITRLAQSPARHLYLLRDRLTAEIHGATLGGGIEMAAFAGRVVARHDTMIGLPEVGLGLIPGAGGTVSVARRIGRQRTAALALTDQRIDAATAMSWGLVDELVDVQL